MKTAKTVVENDVEYTEHKVSSANKERFLGTLRLPKFTTLEELAELVDKKYLTEEDACNYVRGRWAVALQAKIRTDNSPDKKFTQREILLTYKNLDAETLERIHEMSTDDGLAELKKIWRENQPSEDQSEKIYTLLPNNNFKIDEKI